MWYQRSDDPLDAFLKALDPSPPEPSPKPFSPDWDLLWPAALGVVLLGGIVWLMVAGIQQAERDAQAWAAYSRAHHCHVVSHKVSTFNTTVATTPVVGPNGQVMVSITPVTTGDPAMDQWACDDGQTYWREAE